MVKRCKRQIDERMYYIKIGPKMYSRLVFLVVATHIVMAEEPINPMEFTRKYDEVYVDRHQQMDISVKTASMLEGRLHWSDSAEHAYD